MSQSGSVEDGEDVGHAQRNVLLGGQPVVEADWYASWLQRLLAFALDAIFSTGATILAVLTLMVGVAVGVQDMKRVPDGAGKERLVGDWNWLGAPILILGAGLVVAAGCFAVWNAWLRPGRTGYSLGRAIVGIRVVGEFTGTPIGVGALIARYLCHSIVDSLPCYIGWLWPLWDPKRQTFADKIVHSVVVRRDRNQLR